MTEIRVCSECGREMSEDEHNYGTDETCGNIQVCIQCYNIEELMAENIVDDQLS